MKKGHFKGRVVEVSGSKITIDISPETRVYIDRTTGEKKVISSAWEKPDIPKVGDIVRCIFKVRRNERKN